jgi:protein SDA1
LTNCLLESVKSKRNINSLLLLICRQPTEAGSKDFLSTDDLIGHRKRSKKNYEERMAAARASKEDDPKHKSRSAVFKEKGGHGSTNFDKSRKKSWMMQKSKQSLKTRTGRSLIAKQQSLRLAQKKESKRKRH